MPIHLEPTWSFEYLCYLVMDMIFLLWNKFKSVVVCFMIKCEYESMGNRFVWCINGTGTRRLWPLLSSCIWSLYLGCFTWRHCSCCLFSEIGDCDNHLWKKKPYVWFFIWWVRHLVGSSISACLLNHVSATHEKSFFSTLLFMVSRKCLFRRLVLSDHESMHFHILNALKKLQDWCQ